VEIRDPLEALRSVSRDPTWRWLVKRKAGGTIPAVDLQRIYLEAARKRLAGVDASTDWVLAEWGRTLDALESDPMQLVDRLDWVAKRAMYQEYIDSEGVGWQDDILQSLDIEYHNVNRSQSLFHALEDTGRMRRLVGDREIAAAMVGAPGNTRASARAKAVARMIAARSRDYVIDWDMIYRSKRRLELKDPFAIYEAESDDFLTGL